MVIATGWIEWYLEAVRSQVTQAELRLRRSMAEFMTVVTGLSVGGVIGSNASAASRLVIPLWLAVIGGSVTRRQLARYLPVSEETLTRDLRRLCQLGYLAREGMGRAARYAPGWRAQAWGDFGQLVDLALARGSEDVRRRLMALESDQMFPDP